MVVTYNAASTIDRCLSSIPASVPVVVVDNASADETVAIVRSQHPRAQVVANGDNRGFGVASNQGMSEAAGAGADFAVLLNPDAVLDTGALDALVAFARRHPRAGLVSAAITDEEGTSEGVAAGADPTLGRVAVHEAGLGRLFPSLALYQAAGDRAEQRGWVAGTCLLVRMAAVAEVGDFDPAFFLYCEDVDLGRRMRERGWEVWIEPAAKARHLGSASVNTAGEWVDRHRIGSLDQYYRAHHRGPALAAFRLVRVAGKLARALAFWLAGALRADATMRAKARQRRRDAAVAFELLRYGRVRE